MNSDLQARSPIYAWLAERLVLEITAEAWAVFRQEPMRSILVRAEPSLDTSLSSALTRPNRLALEEEFARLFLMPGGVSALASAWVDAPANQESNRQRISTWITQSLTVLGRQARNQDPWGKLPLDHLAVVLDVVSVAALSAKDLEIEVAQQLETDLLAPALLGFGDALVREARAPIFRAIGALILSVAEPS